MAQYIVIENGNKGEPAVPNWMQNQAFVGTYGPFESVKEAKRFILADCDRCLHEDSQIDLGDVADYCSRFIICEIIDVLQPIPKVSITWRLKKTV